VSGAGTDGPLAGVRVVELAGAGGVPFCGMLLADLGADVLRVDRPGAVDRLGGEPIEPRFHVMRRGRPAIALDLKDPAGLAVLLRLVDRADVLVEPFRPGVAERLGFGPDACHERNPGLVYGRLTGWGQDGPLAARAGHDINFIALAGVLDAVGPAGGDPVPPLNLLGDFAGGGLYLAVGVLSALLERHRSGRGQVVDAAMVDGAASLLSFAYGLLAAGRWREARGANLFDGGAPWYATYRTADDQYVSVGPFERRFYADLMTALGLAPGEVPDQFDRTAWPALRERLAAAFAGRTRAEWEERLRDLDVCVTPVLSMREAIIHPHHVARGSFVTVDGVTQPAPAPRLSRTPGRVRHGPRPLRAGAAPALRRWGFTDEELASLRRDGVFDD
jgi:alpha-methylacyl-CoA racemase